ncbi:MAG: RsmE family RNA methyltransferase [Planctomycetota bacterium]
MLFLDGPETPRAGATLELRGDEAHHVARVLRLRVGDRVGGVDGRGGRYELAVSRVERGRVEVTVADEAVREPAPGEPGAPLPHVEIAVGWPRGSRGEEMLARLVQLGVARIVPLVVRRTGPERRAERRDRLERIARENLKQCERAWLPTIDEPVGLAEVLERWSADLPAPPVALDPRADGSLHRVLEADRERDAIGILVGAEGGFDPDEEALWRSVGARAARLAPHVLRIETAAEAAAAVAVCLLERR